MKKTTLIISCVFCCLGLCAATPPTMQFWNDYAAGSTGAFCRVEIDNKGELTVQLKANGGIVIED